MNEADKAKPVEASEASENATATERQSSAALAKLRKENRRWWLKLLVQPSLLLVVGTLLIAGLGMAQRLGWITSGGGTQTQASGGAANVQYICPMLCTPPSSEPGRCPVCEMELVPATPSGSGESLSIEIDAAARRVANIQTVAVRAIPLTRTIRAIGELTYDEGTLKTISAYVDGRLDELYADYTGVVVREGEHLALLYSPRLYSGQVELLLARKARAESQSTRLQRVIQSSGDLYDSARQRLIELGMTATQIQQLEQSGEASSRMHLCAPISGTVIEKLAVEGEYVKEGEAIYRLADLSAVWLMLKLFPEDAASIRYGQRVEAEVQSLPGRKIAGRVAFIDPVVDPETRTVGVRVVIPNEDGQLRVGDYAKATIDAAVNGQLAGETIYDPELAGRFISPRHPHIVESAPGQCRLCGIDLVPASQFGYADQPVDQSEVLVVPRNAVLMAGDASVIYVETQPGRFEIRRVVLGASGGDQISVLEGVKEGEQVATRGNFLIDSQMQLAGNPSLIDPTKAIPNQDSTLSPEVLAALAELSPEDRTLAKSQRICPVTEFALGSMGKPPKVDVNGTPVFLCCVECKDRVLAEPDKYLAILEAARTKSEAQQRISAALAGLSLEDRALAERQKLCPVANSALGSMGTPVKVDLDGTPVFLCCDGCRARLLDEPEKYLAKLATQSAASASQPDDEQMELPPISAPILIMDPTESSASDSDEAGRAIAAALSKLSPADRTSAEQQRICPVADTLLGSMGTPILVMVEGRPVFICCEGCRASLLADPVKYLAKLGKEAPR